MHGTAQDVTEQREADERARELVRQQTAREVAQAAASRFRFLAEASQMLGSSLAIEETLRSVTRLTVPGHRGLVLARSRRRRRRVAARRGRARGSGEGADRTRDPSALSAEPSTNPPAAAALQRGESLLIEDFSEAIIRLAAQDEEHRELLRSLGFRSAMVVPLVARDRLVGLITLATAESGRRFGPDDLSLVKSLADRAALAIDNARLFERAQRGSDARARTRSRPSSHDLRSPLGVMSVNVSLLQEPDLPEAERRARSTA